MEFKKLIINLKIINFFLFLNYSDYLILLKQLIL